VTQSRHVFDGGCEQNGFNVVQAEGATKRVHFLELREKSPEDFQMDFQIDCLIEFNPYL
jgi:hypothetical protein